MKCQEEKLLSRRRDGKWKTSDEISHRCLLRAARNLDGNKADIFYMSMTTDLIMRFVPKTTFAEKQNPSRRFLNKKGRARRRFRVDWDMLVVHEKQWT